jgi:Cys-tRNA synthase (O-phospho-L-seryl-tRNA:Cys-tRNA synthase)
MKITTAQLRQIIKEEIESVMLESNSAYNSYVDRIRQTTDLTSVENDINKDKDLTPEQKKDLLAQVEVRRKKTSTDSMPPAFYPVIF